MAGSEQYTTSLPPDTATQVEALSNDRDLSKSEACKRLIEAGIEYRDQSTHLNQFLATMSAVLWGGAVLLLVGGGVTPLWSLADAGIGGGLLVLLGVATSTPVLLGDEEGR